MTTIIGAFYGNAGKARGAEAGGEILFNSLKKYHNTISEECQLTYKNSFNHGIKCLDEVQTFSKRINTLVYNNLLDCNKCLCIGGDHSISLGTITGAANAAHKLSKKFGVIYIDAHGDLNTIETSNTKNIHGMTLAASMGIGDTKLTKIASNPLSPENLLLLGTRSLDPGENDLIQKYNIKSITSKEIRSISNFDNFKNKISDFISYRDIEMLHISLDIDVIDPMEAPGTGVPEANGLSSSIVSCIIKELITEHPVYSIDFVEYNPIFDVDNKTYNISNNLCREILYNW